MRHLQQCRMTAAVGMVAAGKERRGCIPKTLMRKHRREESKMIGDSHLGEYKPHTQGELQKKEMVWGRCQED